MTKQENLRLRAAGGGTLDFDKLMMSIEQEYAKAKASQEAARIVLEKASFKKDEDFAEAITEVAIQIGRQQAFEFVVAVLKEIRKKVEPKDRKEN